MRLCKHVHLKRVFAKTAVKCECLVHMRVLDTLLAAIWPVQSWRAEVFVLSLPVRLPAVVPRALCCRSLPSWSPLIACPTWSRSLTLLTASWSHVATWAHRYEGQLGKSCTCRVQLSSSGLGNDCRNVPDVGSLMLCYTNSIMAGSTVLLVRAALSNTAQVSACACTNSYSTEHSTCTCERG